MTIGDAVSVQDADGFLIVGNILEYIETHSVVFQGMTIDIPSYCIILDHETKLTHCRRTKDITKLEKT